VWRHLYFCALPLSLSKLLPLSATQMGGLSLSVCCLCTWIKWGAALIKTAARARWSMKERVVYTLSRSVSWIAPLFQSSGVKTEMTPHNNNTTAATHGFHCIRKCATDGMEREESRVETFSQGMLFYFSTNNKRTAAAKTQLLYRPHWWPK